MSALRPELKSSMPVLDSDYDDIPDEWKKQNGLNLNDKKDASIQTLHKGYNNIEVYLNSLVDGK
jgi:hypothetical protein